MVSSVDAVILRTYARCDRERDLASLQLIPAVSSVRPTVRQHLVEPCFEQRWAGELVDRELKDQAAVFLNEPMLALHIDPTIGIACGKRVDRTEVRLFRSSVSHRLLMTDSSRFGCAAIINVFIKKTSISIVA